MRRLFTACGLIVGLLLTSPLFAQSRAKAQNVPEIAYESVPNFLKFPPNLYLGEGIGGDSSLFEFDQNGTFVREIGAGLYGFTFAHAVRVDKDDNIWTVDEGSNMVIKFNPAGRVVMVIGRRPDAVRRAHGDERPGSAPNSNKPYSFNRPTDVGWDAQGNIFVTVGEVGERFMRMFGRAFAFAPILDHIHLNVPDQAKAVEWYQKNFGGTPMTEAPDRLMFGDTRLIFLKNDKGQPSTGSALDHIGWRTPNLAAKTAELKAQTVKFTTEPRPLKLASGTMVNFAYLEGPAGAKIEIVQR